VEKGATYISSLVVDLSPNTKLQLNTKIEIISSRPILRAMSPAYPLRSYFVIKQIPSLCMTKAQITSLYLLSALSSLYSLSGCFCGSSNGTRDSGDRDLRHHFGTFLGHRYQCLSVGSTAGCRAGDLKRGCVET
jgi:hypothetical protein